MRATRYLQSRIYYSNLYVCAGQYSYLINMAFVIVGVADVIKVSSSFCGLPFARPPGQRASQIPLLSLEQLWRLDITLGYTYNSQSLRS